MLAAPPAAAITYWNPSKGLEPSVYGGGGSPSSIPLLDDSAFVSCGSAAFTSASAIESEVREAVAVNAGSWAGSGSVTRTFAGWKMLVEDDGGK